MEEIIRGVERFRREVFPAERGLFAQLAHGQSPKALMITCADSRIDPNQITQSRAGDLFLVRNAGNIIPPFHVTQGAEAASVEYAMEVLNISHIIVCGHTDCGAIKALANPKGLDALRSVKAWLDHAGGALSNARERHAHLEGDDFVRALVEENVLAQIENLKTHPSVAARLDKGTVEIHAWKYDIGNGEVLCHDGQCGRFMAIAGDGVSIEAMA